jgi:excisionase family DNA binding protein
VSRVLSAEEAAQVCGVSPKTVRRWVKSGRLEAVKRGRSFRIERSAFGPFMGQDSAHTNHRNGTVDTPDTGQDTNSGQVVPAGLYRELQAEMVRKAEAAAMWQARAEFLAGELSQAREQLALMAPAGAVWR